ncbi:hypothetical protein [Aquitalea aquatilis]|uniref:hypothetical protein n=1 Tax=Aquitalea aquatilis TaxID=1537400 RepID=UPI0010BDA371|nr:hypothetical protein [Aquitalea aquatilis]
MLRLAALTAFAPDQVNARHEKSQQAVPLFRRHTVAKKLKSPQKTARSRDSSTGPLADDIAVWAAAIYGLTVYGLTIYGLT